MTGVFTVRTSGEMSEWFKVVALKATVAKVTGGSNPSLSDIFINWRGAREAESGSLLRS